MAGDVYVSFGADTGDLEAALAVAKAGVNSYAAEMRKLAQEMPTLAAQITVAKSTAPEGAGRA